MNSIRTVVGDISDVVASIQRLRENSDTLDFSFITKDGQHHRVHKLIAAIHSSVLHDMIYGLNSCGSIEINDVDSLAVMNILRYFYDENIVIENLSDIIETKKIADRYKIKELSRLSKEKLTDIEIKLSNAISVFLLSLEFKNAQKEEEALLIIGENKEAVFLDQSYFSTELENVLRLLERLREESLISETEFLTFGIRWLEENGSHNKNLLLTRIDVSNILMSDFLEIILSFPRFFTNLEIADGIKKIKCSMNSEDEIKSTKENVIEDRSSCKDIGINTDTENKHADKLKFLTVLVLKEEDGVNLFKWSKRVRITFQYESFARSVQYEVCEILAKGTFGSMKKGKSYTYFDIDISYEGVYYMNKLARGYTPPLTPVQQMQVLKASSHFKIKELCDKCITEIGNITDFDPIFLDGLKSFPFFSDRCLHLLKKSPLSVILHPNFIDCSAQLILLLLEQDELSVEEIQLLLVIIMWLESRKPFGGHFRHAFLSKISFECISLADFKYVLRFYPSFFSDGEANSILDFKTGKNEKNLEKLPNWYSFKHREYCKRDSVSHS